MCSKLKTSCSVIVLIGFHCPCGLPTLFACACITTGRNLLAVHTQSRVWRLPVRANQISVLNTFCVKLHSHVIVMFFAFSFEKREGWHFLPLGQSVSFCLSSLYLYSFCFSKASFLQTHHSSVFSFQVREAFSFISWEQTYNRLPHGMTCIYIFFSFWVFTRFHLYFFLLYTSASMATPNLTINQQLEVLQKLRCQRVVLASASHKSQSSVETGKNLKLPQVLFCFFEGGFFLFWLRHAA